MGFSHIIDLNADPSEESLSRRASVSYHPVKTIDEYGFSLWMTNLQKVVSIIEQATQHNGKVFLHCTYGRGRSPTMAMAYLISKDWSIEAAREHVKRRARMVWDEGNPVLKYERILQMYANARAGHRRIRLNNDK
jgi:protein-tyrosine phosphatase